jgi:hypothetical protein
MLLAWGISCSGRSGKVWDCTNCGLCRSPSQNTIDRCWEIADLWKCIEKFLAFLSAHAHNDAVVSGQTFCRCSNSGSPCQVLLDSAFDRFYWVNPYDTLADCEIKKGANAKGGKPTPLRLGSLAWTQAREALAERRALRHTIACADRR